MDGENFFHEYVEPYHHHNSENTSHYNNQYLMFYCDDYFNGTSISSKERMMKTNSNENQNCHEFDTFSSRVNPTKFKKNDQFSPIRFHNTPMIHTHQPQIFHRFQISQERLENALQQELYPIPDSTANILSNAQCCSLRSKKKTRILFTKEQVLELETRFRRQRYLTAIERDDIASLINLTSNQVKIWFQNRRYKSKKMTEIPSYKSSSKLFANTSNLTRSSH